MCEEVAGPFNDADNAAVTADAYNGSSDYDADSYTPARRDGNWYVIALDAGS